MPQTWRKITVLAVLMLLCFTSACQSRRKQKQGGVVVAMMMPGRCVTSAVSPASIICVA